MERDVGVGRNVATSEGRDGVFGGKNCEREHCKIVVHMMIENKK